MSLLVAAIAACNAAGEAGDDGATLLRAETSAEAVPSSPANVEHEAWPPPGCDAVYEVRAHGPGGPGTPYLVQPGGEFTPKVVLDAPWGDEVVQAIAFKSLTDNKKVVHHWILQDDKLTLLHGWSPGNAGYPLPQGTGLELPRGKQSLVMDMHYYNLRGTQVEPDQSGVAICVVRGENLRKTRVGVHTGFNVVRPLMVPANARDHELRASCQVEASEPVTLYAISPHAHTLSRRMQLSVTKKDGREILALDRPYAFDAQIVYLLETPITLETGDVVHTSCTYDNPSNRNIPFGESSDTEMCFNFGVHYPFGALRCGATLNELFGGARPATPPG